MGRLGRIWMRQNNQRSQLLLVFHSNCGSILLCFGDMNTGRNDVSHQRVWLLRGASSNNIVPSNAQPWAASRYSFIVSISPDGTFCKWLVTSQQLRDGWQNRFSLLRRPRLAGDINSQWDRFGEMARNLSSLCKVAITTMIIYSMPILLHGLKACSIRTRTSAVAERQRDA